ncbi:hypothetical protein ACVDFE_26890 [Lentzea chajnantorensis]
MLTAGTTSLISEAMTYGRHSCGDRVSRSEDVRISLLGLPLTTIKATRVRLTGVQT